MSSLQGKRTVLAAVCVAVTIVFGFAYIGKCQENGTDNANAEPAAKPLPPELIAAWKKAGAFPAWMTPPAGGHISRCGRRQR